MIAVLVVLVGGGLAVVNFGFDKTRRTAQTITEPVGTIIVRTGTGDVRLVPTSTSIEVREAQHHVIKMLSLKLSVENGVLTIDIDCATAVITCCADLRVTVPMNIAVTVDADSGDIDARALRARSVHA